MSDLEKYIEQRKSSDPEFANGFEEGYLHFKIGVMLKQERLKAGFTQEEIANRLNTKKSAISRIEKVKTFAGKIIDLMFVKFSNICHSKSICQRFVGIGQ